VDEAEVARDPADVMSEPVAVEEDTAVPEPVEVEEASAAEDTVEEDTEVATVVEPVVDSRLRPLRPAPAGGKWRRRRPPCAPVYPALAPASCPRSTLFDSFSSFVIHVHIPASPRRSPRSARVFTVQPFVRLPCPCFHRTSALDAEAAGNPNKQ